ncbi:MAG: hypothetical protein C0601_08845 [Candidatus Muiribacterium halophilum]|uniref:Uncharacterized protein n=1 Tax=Muiribacterium halophilum TaxID=2053465 RepID=A0A2N5ZE45_MUIH1|nr:MAG: hypothetical protein C0601_08845 [Candidatus Muirbacterium halophilum]
MRDIIVIFVVLIALFTVIGFTPLCGGCDPFKLELDTMGTQTSDHINWETRHRNHKKKVGSCHNGSGECGGNCEGHSNSECSGNCEGKDESECSGSCKGDLKMVNHCREEAKGVCGNNMNSKENKNNLITISQIRKDAASFDSKQVYMEVIEGIRPGDAEKGLEQLSTRSDCYVHDATGTMVLRNGWQFKNAYMQGVKADKDYVFIDDNIKIEKGRWYINPFVYSRYSKTILSLRKFD